MADDLTNREIFIDLTATGARTIRTPGLNRIHSIRVRGTVGASAQNIVLRRTTASTGPIIFQQLGPADTEHDGTEIFPPNGMEVDGIFMDNLTNAWDTGAFMIIYTEGSL